MDLGPFDLTGGPFLLLYLFLLIGAVMADIGVANRLRPPGRARAVTDPDMLAVLEGGKGRFVETLVARLLARGAVVFAGRTALAAVPGARGETAAELWLLRLSAPISWSTIRSHVADYADPVKRKLENAGLFMSSDEAGRLRWWQTLPYLVLIGFGTIKLLIGEARDRPIVFLSVLLIVTMAIAVVRWTTFDRRTQAALAVLCEAKMQNERAARAPTAGDVGIAVALFGTGVLEGSQWSGLHRMRSARDGGSDGGSGGDVHGSHDSDSGSGCGGGGCGGCGS